MERTSTELILKEKYDLIRENLVGYTDGSVALKALNELMEIVDSRPKWPEELHNQYLKVLDERDKAIERAEQSEELLRYLRELLLEE